MEVKLIENVKQKEYCFDRLFMDHYMLQIEATTCTNEPDNRLNIIFPDGVAHFQIANESYKTMIWHKLKEFREQHNYNVWFLEILSKEEYGKYLKEESNGIFFPEDFSMYYLLFNDDIIEIVTYDTKPIFVYSYTGEYDKD